MINRNKISGFDSKFIKNASIFYFKSIKEAKETIDLYRIYIKRRNGDIVCI